MKTLISLLLIITSINVFSQTLVGNVFTTNVKNGAGQPFLLSFKISDETIQRLKQSEAYASTINDTAFVRKYINPVTRDTLALCLMSRVNMAVLLVKFELKNQTSMQFISGSEGLMFYSGDSKDITITFPLQAQNDYGALIFLTGSSTGVKASVFK